MSKHEWMWWGSADRERWSGPYETKEEAIAEHAGHYICEAIKQDYRLDFIDLYFLEEMANDANEDLIDPDGDGVFGTLSVQQKVELEREVTATIKAWAERQGINLTSWAFADTRNEEFIEQQPAHAAAKGE